MYRRRYLAVLSALGGGTVVGCTTATPTGTGATTDGSEAGEGDQSTDGRHRVETSASSTDAGRTVVDYGTDDGGISGETVSLELWNRFVLDERDVAIIVTGTERRAGTDGETTTRRTGIDVFVVSMVVENVSDDRVEVDRDLFWLEGLPQAENTPDPTLTARLDDGITDETKRFGPGEETTIDLAFAISESFEPSYLWVERYYVCLV